jgi:acetyl-CoA carboxylase biotin carboxyl carrier protein
MTLGYDDIAEILKIIDSSSCDEVIIETGDIKLVVRRNGASQAGSELAPQQNKAGPPASPPPTNLATATPQHSPPAGAKFATTSNQFEITAPMVGTFYRAPSPDARPFVEIDSMVQKGQPLCLIEVMKLFTTIYAERGGRVRYIGVENGAFVEFGQTLFVLEPV